MAKAPYNEQIRTVCKFGIKHEMCIYLGMGEYGYVCMKTYSMVKHKYKMGPERTKEPLGGNCIGKPFHEMND